MIKMIDRVLQELFATTASSSDLILHHCLDPLAADGGPFQQLACQSAQTDAETPSVAVSDTLGDIPDTGYPTGV